MHQPVRTRIVHALAAACLVLTLSACTEGDPTDPTPAPPLSPTAPASPTKASTSKPDGPPQMPNKAKKNTKAGAVAFVKHFIKMRNYAGLTGDTKGMRQLYSERCNSCSALAKYIDDLYTNGGRHEGEVWLVKKATFETRQGAFAAVALVAEHTGGDLYVSATAKPKYFERKPRAKHLLEAEWKQGEWRLVGIDPEPS